MAMVSAYAAFFVYLLLVQAGFSLLVWFVLRPLRLEHDVGFSLSYSGGILLFSLFGLGMAWVKVQPSLWLGAFVLGVALLVLAFYAPALRHSLTWRSLSLPFFFVFMLGLRLPFIHNLLVPPYADSVQHVLIVQDMLQPDQPPQAFYTLSLNLQTYYHFGFHALAAWLSGSTNTTPAETILILGQYFQALAVIAVYPLAHKIFKSTFAAWGVIILVGLFFAMPAHASNWGKYPAIASLVGISFCLGLFAVLQQAPQPGAKGPILLFWLGALATFFLHSRTLPVFLLVFLIFKSLSFLKIAWPAPGHLTEEMGMAAFAVAGLLILMLFLIYDDLPLPFCFLIVFGFIAAFYFDFKTALGLTLFPLLIILLGGLPLFASFLPARFGSLIDAPYQALLLFLPASLLIWLAVEGLLHFFGQQDIYINPRVVLSVLLFAGCINALYFQDQRPSACCIFLDDDDLFSFEWMKRNLPVPTVVGIAATGDPGNYLPADGGAWLEPMTGIPTRKLAYNTDFPATTAALCTSGVKYLYLDALDNSFDEFEVAQSGAQYIFGFETIRIYALGCED
jgi:hypothetical protein